MMNSDKKEQDIQLSCERHNDWILTKHRASFTPVVVSRKARRNYPQEKSTISHPWMAVATGCYISHQQKKWLVTADHVITKLEKEHKSAPIYVQSDEKLIELAAGFRQIKVVRFSQDDVVVIALEDAENFGDVEWIEHRDVIHAPTSHQFRVGMYGYLRKHHKSISGPIDIVQFLTRVLEPEQQGGDNQVYIDFDRRAFAGDVDDGNLVPQPDGFSGGPVFGLGTVRELMDGKSRKLRFCGMLIEQSDVSDQAVYVDAAYLFRCVECADQTLFRQ